MKSINWKLAILTGIIGTILFDLFGFVMTSQWWDVPSILGEKTGLGIMYGIFAHYSNGILLAVLYAGIVNSLWGPMWIRPFLFISVQTIALVWLFMFPLLGAGVAGIKLGVMTPIASMLRHWVYVIPFVFLINKESKSFLTN